MLSHLTNPTANKGAAAASGLFDVPFILREVPQAQYFVGRESELEELHQILLPPDGGRSTVVLHGLGGIGKTQLAVHFAKKFRRDYSAIFWLNSKDESGIRLSFSRAKSHIARHHPGDHNKEISSGEQSTSDDFEFAEARLSLGGNTRWLLIYDNYDDPSSFDIESFLPSVQQGSVIITKRLSQIDIGHNLRIKKLEQSESSMELLVKVSGREDIEHDTDTKALLTELDGLPLALTAAGSYLRRVSICTGEYLRLYKESWERVQTRTPQLGSYKDRTLSSTWQISYYQVKQQNEAAAYLLRLWAYLDNDDVWYELFGYYRQDNPAWRAHLADKVNFHDAMATLHDYGFVEAHAMGPGQIESRGYSIHNCLHSWVYHVLNDNDSSMKLLAIEIVGNRDTNGLDFSKAYQGTWHLERRLLPHALALSTITGTFNCTERLRECFIAIGNVFLGQMLAGKAQAMYERALEGIGNGELEMACKLYNNLCLTLFDQGDLQAAEKMALQALSGLEELFGAKDPATLRTVENLGRIYGKDPQRLVEAETMLLRVYDVRREALGTNNGLTLRVAHELGRLYMRQPRKHHEAEDILLSVLQAREQVFGSDHPETSKTRHVLGYFYANQERFEEAKTMLLRALNGYENVNGPCNLDDYEPVPNAWWLLGTCYTNCGEHTRGLEYMERALRGYKKTNDPNLGMLEAHIATAQGKVHQSQGSGTLDVQASLQ